MNQFSARIRLKSFSIDRKTFEICDFCYSEINLISIEHSFLPKGTVRFIGEIPWEVVDTVKSIGLLKNLIFNRRFSRTYKVLWRCVGEEKFSRDQFEKLIIERLKSLVD